MERLGSFHLRIEGIGLMSKTLDLRCEISDMRQNTLDMREKILVESELDRI